MRADRRRAGAALGWVAGWTALLALAGWTRTLQPGWLLAAGVLAALATVLPLHAGRRWRLGAAAAVAAALSIAGAVQMRLNRAEQDWDRTRRAVEDRAGAALERELGRMLDGHQAAADRAIAATRGRQRATRGLFDAVREVRRGAGATALAVFEPDGSPFIWSGEHRGTVPDSVRAGLLPYSFSNGPLFGYVYFTRRAPDGRVAVAAQLLEAHVEAGRAERPYAERFQERYGVRPRFTAPEMATDEMEPWDWSDEGRPFLSVIFVGALTQEAWRQRVVATGRWGAGLATLAAGVLLALAWGRRRRRGWGVPVAAATAALLVVPLGELAGRGGEVFSPIGFVLPGPADVTLGQLLVVLCGGAVWLLTRPRPGGLLARLPLPLRALAAGGAVLGSVALVRGSASPEALATRPAGGLATLLAATLLGALLVRLLLEASPRAAPDARRALLGLPAALLALALAAWVGLGWTPSGSLPGWTPLLWALPAGLAAAALGRPGSRTSLLAWVMACWIAGTAATAHLWTAHQQARLEAAERELAQLGTQADPFLDYLLREFAEEALFSAAEGREGVGLLYQAWVESGLARAGYEARLTLWQGEEPAAELRLSDARIPEERVAGVLAGARASEEPVVQRFTDQPDVHYLLASSLTDGQVVTVAVPPRRHLGRATALAGFLDPVGERQRSLEGASLALVPSPAASPAGRGTLRWLPAEGGWRSEAEVRFPGGPMHAHLLVATPSRAVQLTRGLLVCILLVGLLSVLWVAARTLCGEPLGVPGGRRLWVATFRGRLTLALFVFFLLPMAGFGGTAYRALSNEVVRTASAVADRALAQAAAETHGEMLGEVAGRLGVELLLYHRGALAEAAAPEAIDLGLYHAWLPSTIFLDFTIGEATDAREERRLGGQDYLLAYRRLGDQDVLASPTPLASGDIARRRRELTEMVLLAGLLGAALSVVLALWVGRALSRPIEGMSLAAARVGEGDLGVRLPEERRDEFGRLYRAFNEMVQGLREVRAELLGEQRRTEAIVTEAGTGVVALDAQGRVALINRRACEILGVEVAPGEPLPQDGPLPASVAGVAASFVADGASERAEEREVDGRVIRLRLRRLPTEQGGRGAVLVLEDVTSELRSARVLAWGEMARQVAHEIKNPLTPMKLAVQHVRRAWADGRGDFGLILERNADAVLREIDRLGEIARAFARFGTPSEPGATLERVQVRRVLDDTLALYRSGEDGIRYEAELPESLPLVWARPGELKEVLVNLLENARAAMDAGGAIRISAAPTGGDAWVQIDLADTGEGIDPESLPRVFEPQFSTRTSGTGLGLAIVKRLVESWGGEVTLDSQPGNGTVVHLRLAAADHRGP